MELTLRGSSPCATTAGIMLLTRARQLGDSLTVRIVGDADDLVAVRGPAICYAPVLASCGVGREHGSGATVVVPGNPGEPLIATVTPHGEGGWFEVDRGGTGAHPASMAFSRISADPRPEARQLGRMLRDAMRGLGLSTDAAVLDVLFGAELDPLTRVALGLRTGRAMAGGRGEPITRFLTGLATRDPLSAPTHGARDEDVTWVLDGFTTAVRDPAEQVLRLFCQLAESDGGRDLVLLDHLAWLASALVQLPHQSILPPLGAAEDSVATGLAAALAAEGDGDANRQLAQTFRFLGGRYVASADHVVDLGAAEAPAGRVARWTWFGTEVRRGRKLADALWPNLVDPPS